MILHLLLTLEGLLLVKAMVQSAVLAGILLHGQFIPSLTCSSLAPNLISNVSISWHGGSFLIVRLHTCILVRYLALLYSSLYVLFHVQSTFTHVSLFSGLHISAIVGEYLLR